MLFPLLPELLELDLRHRCSVSECCLIAALRILCTQSWLQGQLC